MIELPKPVLTKSDFVIRYGQGEFGNCSPTWNDWYEFEESDWEVGPNQLFHLRNRVAGGETWYNLNLLDLFDLWMDTIRYKDTKQFYISAMCPTELTMFQGEVMRSINSLELFYTTVAKPMRDALKERSRVVRGVTASLLLKHYLCPNSLEWLEHLLDSYPEHVVEFTTLSTNWGTVPGFNTLFWEIRKS